MKMFFTSLFLSSLALGQNLPTVRLRDVHKVFIPTDPSVSEYGLPFWNTLIYPKETKFDGRKVSTLVGDCATGYRTHIDGLVLVCKADDADAFLLPAGTKSEAEWAKAMPARTNCTSSDIGNNVDSQCTTHGGGISRGVETVVSESAALVLRSNSETIWQASRDNRANPLQGFALGASQSGATHVGDENYVALRILKQLRRDYEASVKAH